MKIIRFGPVVMGLLFILLVTTVSPAQVSTPSSPTPPTAPVIGAIRDTSIAPGTSATSILSADSLPDSHLDKAVTALNDGDKATTTQELQTGIKGLETELGQKPSSFKDKVLAQVSKLKALLPLIAGGGLSSGVLQKAVNLTKLASGAGRLESLISAGSLIGKASQLTSGLSGLGSAMSVLGGGTQSTGQSLISTALAGVSKLNQGGAVAKTAEPAVKSQIGSILNLVKGAL